MSHDLLVQMAYSFLDIATRHLARQHLYSAQLMAIIMARI